MNNGETHQMAEMALNRAFGRPVTFDEIERFLAWKATVKIRPISWRQLGDLYALAARKARQSVPAKPRSIVEWVRFRGVTR